ncbi:MAG: isoprenylcysteine carboxylmethyltransferase family protein [Deltaproteobacteria bacterium]|uniref:methyltransferase family protein n=1 Tax=Desulfobacula sp. TaxID=2593537 RepID=UPI0019BDD565|nr:isoprenylcysteine carboxylmethyltransferase family protein [Candidatus Desulfobacula maris]MBL6995831.1 isoprenylcysteine carboxylmethyltransferase family protein [Desulfobacula sp.]
MIIDLYQTADFNKRLNLFLEHRSLRRVFISVEMNPNQKKCDTTADKHIQRYGKVKFLSALIGGGSLIYFLFFLIFGTILSIPAGMNSKSALMLDFGLSLMFFFQHSIMVRAKFKTILEKTIPEVMIPAFYSIVSGITLICTVLFWQETGQPIFVPPIWVTPIMSGAFTLGIIGFYWGVKSLPFFDPLGVRIKKMNSKKPSLKLIGPYRLLRHPLYFFMLIIIWASTSFTLDRILFNCLWSLWILMGAWLEEKELLTVFGQDYLKYQQQVPMLFPIKKGYLKYLNQEAKPDLYI